MSNNLYDWVFHYNTYTNTWHATQRDNYPKLFSNIASDDVLRSKSIDTLVSLISKTNGELSKIKKLIGK